jgi:hypothetical protein
MLTSSLNEDTHARGWTPSWLIGKFPKDTRDGKEIGTVKEATRIQGAVSPRLLELPSGEARPT